MIEFMQSLPSELWGFAGIVIGAVGAYLAGIRTSEVAATELVDASIRAHLERQDSRIRALEAEEDKHRAFEKRVHELYLEGRTVAHKIELTARKQSMLPPQKQVKLPDTARFIAALDAVSEHDNVGTAREPPTSPG